MKTFLFVVFLYGLLVWSAVGCGSAGPTAPTTPTPPPAGIGASVSSLATELAYCVTVTNQYRATLGLPALDRSSELEAYAAVGAEQDGRAHAAHQHFKTTSGVAFAENEIPWWSHLSSVHDVIRQGIAQMWAEGPGGGHYENIRGRSTALGCGVYMQGNEITVVQDFR